MAEKVLIIMANSDPQDGQLMLTPLAQAMAAAAMEYQVEVIFCGRCVDLLRPGFAEKVSLVDGRTIYDVLKEASESDVSLKVCTMALEQPIDEVIPEVEERVGGAYLIGESMQDTTETFTY